MLVLLSGNSATFHVFLHVRFFTPWKLIRYTD